MMNLACTKTCRLLSMLFMTTFFFLVEIVIGYITGSLALIADSFHMLSDVVALFVGFSSVRVSKWSSTKNTFGWARAEVMGALVNSVFLIALCFSIFVEGIQRFLEIGEGHGRVKHAKLLLITGIVGLVVNALGLLLFHEHAHTHSSHGHSHGNNKKKSIIRSTSQEPDHDEYAQQHTEDHTTRTELNCEDVRVTFQNPITGNEDSVDNSAGDGTHRNSLIIENQTPPPQQSIDAHFDATTTEAQNSAAQLNMRGVFLHILGDALGSVIVIISATVIWQVPEGNDWKFYIDPAMSMLLVMIILSTTIPLLRESSMILMQTVPTHIHVQDIQDRLVATVKGVLAVHEFHVWQLAGSRIIASAHVRCSSLAEYMRLAEEVKEFFHKEGIHSTTIQPEFPETDTVARMEKDGRTCVLECGPERDCHGDTCCGTKKLRSTRSEYSLRQRAPPALPTVPSASTTVESIRL